MKDKNVFISKKNYVYYNEATTSVVKQFVLEEDFLKEMDIYSRLEDIRFKKKAKVLAVNKEKYELHLEFLEGVTLLSKLESLEQQGRVDEAVKILLAVIQWLEQFYNALELTMGDVNLRNFIFVNEEIYGIDFENVEKRTCYEEKVELLSRYLIYDPIKTSFKQEVVKHIIHHMYEVEKDSMNKKKVSIEVYELADTILDMRKTRKLKKA